jgi:hypothetical protein
LADAYIILVEEALKPNGGAATWGPEGYYFAATTEHVWADVTAAIARIAHSRGLIPSAEVEQLTVEKAAEAHPWGPLLWGGNCRSRADRFRALGWKPSGPSIYDSLPEMVDFEARSFGNQASTTTFDSKAQK